MNDWIIVHRKKIDEHLKKIIQVSSWDNLLKQASLYSLEKGKRLRPLIALMLFPVSQKIPKDVLDAVCALELLHTYSLIHDDLPCMDDDDFRRGKPSLHKAFSESTAVLTGDALLTKPFEILSSLSSLSCEDKNTLVHILSYYAGGSYLVSGQILDLKYSSKKLTLQDVININSKKTSSLMVASLLFGSVLAKLPLSCHPLLKRLGENMGIYYQILDDRQDYDPNIDSLNLVRILGKTKALTLAKSYKGAIEKDLKKLKNTIPTINLNLLSSLIKGWK